jgi:aspartate/methionine/tyrosine aminotransferase
VTTLPVKYGYAPLRTAIARRYGVDFDQVYYISGGTSFANWLVFATALEGVAPRNAEVIVEQPTFETLLRLPQSFGVRIRRLDRRFEENYAIDLDRFKALVTPKTRLAIVSNLHNPTGARIGAETLREMAAILARVGALLVVDEVYLESLWGRRTASCVHAGPNVVTTSSLTKAYGLDGLRAGWVLGPAAFVDRLIAVHTLVTNNGVAPGEMMALAAFKHLGAIGRRAQDIMKPNLERVRQFFARETRLPALVPEGGNVMFPRLPEGIDADLFTAHLREHYATQVIPGRFFEVPRHIRISYGFKASLLEEGLQNLSRALDDLTASPASRPAARTEGRTAAPPASRSGRRAAGARRSAKSARR